MINISVIRKNKGFTQEDIAKMMKVTRTTVSRWETGERNISLRQASKLAFFLGVATDDLISEEKSAS